jgi:basic membrane protein A
MEEADRNVNGKTRTIVAALLALMLVLAFVPGCTTEKESDSDEPTNGDNGAETPTTDVKAAMITDTAGLGDKSFNDLTWQGFEQAEDELGVQVEVLESATINDYESNLDQLALAGYSPLVATGFMLTDTVSKVAPMYPDTMFINIDGFFDPVPPNVVGVGFKENEGSYLAGVVAGLATIDTFDDRLNDQNVIGFVGGMDVPLIRKFQAGFEAGAKSVNPDIKVIALYTGSWSDVAKGKELGLSLIEQGADVIYAAAGGCGEGTVRACQEKGALFIGVDADQYNTIANSGDVMLTSMMKNIDVVVFDLIKAMVDDEFPAGTMQVFGLKEGGVGLAPWHDFDSKVPQSIKDAVDKATDDIISGAVTVPEAL